jgi:hypothetical protein
VTIMSAATDIFARLPADAPGVLPQHPTPAVVTGLRTYLSSASVKERGRPFVYSPSFVSSSRLLTLAKIRSWATRGT